MALSGFQRSAIRLLRGVALRFVSPGLEEAVQRARLGVRAEVVAASALLAGGLTFVVVAVLLALVGFVILPSVGLVITPLIGVVLVATPGLLAAVTAAIMFTAPSGRASSRARSIEANLPYALNYLSSLTSAGVTVHKAFESLAGQTIYGQLTHEAIGLTKDIHMGVDTVNALRRAAERSPSGAWSEVLQGAVATTVSGGDLSGYFEQKAERYSFENKEMMKQLVEVMGLMSETYVTVAVAGPLFLIIMGTIMTMLGSGGPSLLPPLIYIGLPFINIGFAAILRMSMPEV